MTQGVSRRNVFVPPFWERPNVEVVDASYLVYAEEITRYVNGGFHPLNIGDLFGPDRRFRVINKLGNGTYGVVWLCRDLEDDVVPWKAVKVNNARSTEESSGCTEARLQQEFANMGLDADSALENQICIPYQNFWADGRNGRHLCSILPVLGPTIHEALVTNPDLDERQLCKQVTKAMSFLHVNGIFHGDFRPDNCLTQVEGLQLLDEDEIREVFGIPRIVPVATIGDRYGFSGNPSRQPRHLVISANMNMEVLDRLVYEKTGERMSANPKVAVVDFGCAAHVDWDTRWESYIPREHLCPAVMLGYPASFATDVFALGVTLCILLVGEYPFIRKWERVVNPLKDYFPGLEEALGPMPLNLRRRCENRAREFGYSQGLKLTRDEYECATAPTQQIIQWRNKWVGHVKGADSIIHGQLLESGMSEFEADLFVDLLMGLCDWDPGDRLSMYQVIQHSWMTGRGGLAGKTRIFGAQMRFEPTDIKLLSVNVSSQNDNVTTCTGVLQTVRQYA